MTATPAPTCVIVPGMRDHVPEHWQTILADKLPDTRTVPPLNEDGMSRDARVSALDRVLADVSGPVVLVAHSAGVMTTVHWAQRHRRPVRGALLATPPDFERPLPEGVSNHRCPAGERLDTDPENASALRQHRCGEQQ